MNAKKILSLLLALVMVFALVACGNGKDKKGGKDTKSETTADGGKETKKIDTLKVQFVPSRDPEAVTNATKPLEDILKKYLAKEGYEVGKIDVSVSTSYEAAGEALSAGSVDVAFIPGGTYVLYDDGADVLLTATRKGLSVQSEDPKEWNEKKPIKNTDEQVSFYRAMVLAGPSAKGQELAKKINSGQKLTWEELNSAKWGVQSATSSSGYIYPTLWLKDNYDGKTIKDLANVVQVKGYSAAMAQLASSQLDILVAYTDARLDNVKQWKSDWKGKDIWEDTNILGISSKIYNDTISVSKNSKVITDDFKKALSNAFIKLAQTTEGKEIIKIYNHDGYKEAKPSDYDKERQAQELIKNSKKSQ